MNQKDREIIEIIRNLSGETIGRVDNVLKALMIYTTLNHAENEIVTIPYFGTFKLTYKGEKFENGELKQEFDTYFSPSQELKKNISKLKDIQSYGGNIIDVPIFQDLKNSTIKKLNKILE